MTEQIRDEALTGAEIAVIGMAGRFPGAGNLDEFWENLKNGVESISFFTDEELIELGATPGELQAPNYVKAKGIITGIESFDAVFFDYRPAEVEKMEPQNRVFHECTWEALENAGYSPASYDGSIGLYGGSTANFEWEVLLRFHASISDTERLAAVQLIYKDFLTTSLSYKLDLKGPSFPIQTACSTSLLAIHLACQGLLAGECDIALAGGVSVTLPLKRGYYYSDGMINSPDGHCRSFDQKAEGTVFGNGAGIVVLKLLEEATADGDTIYAVIKGSAINNDGNRKVGFTAPSTRGQAEAIASALRAAEVEPESIGYIETHGTATSVGDPIEIEALKLAFETAKTGFCRIGSVKSNIGHLDTAAGVAGFIKVVLSLQHRLLPPSLHFETPNPRLELENTPFYLNTQLSAWESAGYPLRAGISSFGFGGTNAHVILEQAPERAEEQSLSRQYQLILLSARTGTALDKMTGNLANHFKANPGINLADAAYTLQVGRSMFKHRRMVVCADVNEAAAALTNPESGNLLTFSVKKEKSPLVFMFPGQGSQYVNMGLDLYRTEPVFRDQMDRCFAILRTLMGYDIKEILYPENSLPDEPGKQREANDAGTPGISGEKIDQTEITQPVIFAFEYALASLLMSWGVEIYAMIGHSIGEFAAACISGVFSLEDALNVVVKRGQLMQKVPSGAMLSVQLPGEKLQALLSSHHELALAAENTPGLQVVSGPPEAVDRFTHELKEKGYESRLLHTSHAFHSPMMDPVLAEFEKAVRQVTLNEPQIPYISNVTGAWITGEEAADPGYWSRHLRQTIQFSGGLRELFKKENAIFLEVGPGQVLSTFVRKHPEKKPGHMAINLTRHPKEEVSDLYYLITKLGQLWLYGGTFAAGKFYSGETRQRIPLPTYPFEKQRYWKYMDGWHKRGEQTAGQPEKNRNLSGWFYIPSWKRLNLPDVSNMLDVSNQPDRIVKNEQPGEAEQKPGQKWLVFLDEYGLGTRLQEKLEALGHRVAAVEKGTQFRNVNDLRYMINPGEAGDYSVLLEELKKVENIPTGIIYLWSISGTNPVDVAGSRENPHNREFLDESLDREFYSLMYLARAMVRCNIPQRIQLNVVSNNMQEVTGRENLEPAKAMILGIIKVLPQEYPHINCRSIDIDPDLTSLGAPAGNQLLGDLTAEVLRDPVDTVVAFRNNYRWVQIFDPVTIDEEVKNNIKLREKGVYLITGGLGGIGLALAEALARSVRARLVLIGRTGLPPRDQWDNWLETCSKGDNNIDPQTVLVGRRIGKLQELEALGAEVLPLSANVADEQDMRTLVAAAEKQFGVIHGVIHAAGVLNRETFLPIEEIGKDQCKAQFLPKIQGLKVLENVLQGKDLDFCLLTSSLSSVLGGLGYCAYAAANIFMDAFVYYHNRQNRIKWTSVNLDHWDTTVDALQSQNRESPADRMVIMPAEGVEAIRRVLSWCDGNIHQVVISTGHLQTRINQWINLEAIRETSQEEKEDSTETYVQERPELSTPYVTPTSQMEEMIATIWSKFLGIDKVGIHDNFFELGATSMDIIQVNNKLKEALKRNIPVVRMFEFPTVTSLAKKLSAEESGEAVAETKKDRSSELTEGKKLLSQRLQKRLGGRQEMNR